jgi:DNA-binding transcriptional regulator YhcF (GntR family)
MQLKARNGVPAYQRIQGAIRKIIDAGGLRPGDAVPSERELARIHAVSLMTARHALATLEQEGVVERRRGVGTFVSTPKIHFNKLMSYTEQMRSRSLTAGSKVLFAEIVDDEPEATARLSLSPKSHILKLERLRHTAGEPFALETCYFSAKQFAVWNPGAALQSCAGLRGRGSGCNRRRSADSRTFGSAKARAAAENPASNLLHEGHRDCLCAGNVPFRQAQPGDSSFPLIEKRSYHLQRQGPAHLLAAAVLRANWCAWCGDFYYTAADSHTFDIFAGPEDREVGRSQ